MILNVYMIYKDIEKKIKKTNSNEEFYFIDKRKHNINNAIRNIFIEALNRQCVDIRFYCDEKEIISIFEEKYYYLFKEIIILKFLRGKIEKEVKYSREIDIDLTMIKNFSSKLEFNSKDLIYQKIYNLYYEIFEEFFQVENKIFLLSFIGKKFSDYEAINKLIHIVRTSKLSIKDCIYIYIEIKVEFYEHINKIELYNLYLDIINRLNEKFKNEKVKLQSKNENNYIIMTSQFLSYNHAPTKLVLDLARDLVEKHKKNVLIISTKELSIKANKNIMIYNGKTYNKNTLLDGNHVITYEGCKLNFYQIKHDIIYNHIYREIIELISNFKPRAILTVGGENFIGDIINEFIPKITIPTTNSFPISCGSYFVWYGEKNNKYYEEQKERNIKEENIIFSRRRVNKFSQLNTFTKEELKISNKKFIVCIVGNRLDVECFNNKNFMRMLKSLPQTMEILFVGEIRDDHLGVLDKNMNYIGYKEDLLSVYDNIDVFLNPPRNGGGISALMALYKNKPVVTLNYGDVYLNCRKEFSVSNLEDMKLELLKLSEDKDYYNKKVECAKVRINYVMSDERELLDDIIELKL